MVTPEFERTSSGPTPKTGAPSRGTHGFLAQDSQRTDEGGVIGAGA